jgi:hypothetical protein
MFTPDQFRTALRIYSSVNCAKIRKRLRGGPVKQALAILIKSGNNEKDSRTPWCN